MTQRRTGFEFAAPLPSGGMWHGLPEPGAGRVRSEGTCFSVEMLGFWGEPADSAHPGKVGWLPTQTRVCSRSASAFLPPVCALSGSDFRPERLLEDSHVPDSCLHSLTHQVRAALVPWRETSNGKAAHIPPPVCIVARFLSLSLAHIRTRFCVGRNKAHRP